jgi:tripartite-type tricarboxylate transporter receptor subunit TctC
LGLINAPKTITSHLLGDPGAANLLEDLQIFARVARSRHVWVVNPIAGIDSADQIMSANPPMVFGATDKRSSGFLATLLTTEFLQFEFDALVGIGGSKKRILALIRGDIDFFSLSFSSLRTELESGDIKAVLQITATPISDHAVLENVPLLGGKDGFAAKRARQLGTNVQQAMELASATEAFIGAGRIIVGPKAFESELASCIEQTFVTVLNGPAFRSDAEQLYRPLDVASGRETVASLTSSLSQVANYIGLLEQNALKFDQ